MQCVKGLFECLMIAIVMWFVIPFLKPFLDKFAPCLTSAPIAVVVTLVVFFLFQFGLQHPDAIPDINLRLVIIKPDTLRTWKESLELPKYVVITCIVVGLVVAVIFWRMFRPDIIESDVIVKSFSVTSANGGTTITPQAGVYLVQPNESVFIQAQLADNNRVKCEWKMIGEGNMNQDLNCVAQVTPSRQATIIVISIRVATRCNTYERWANLVFRLNP